MQSLWATIYTMVFPPSCFHQLPLVGGAWLHDIQQWGDTIYHVGREGTMPRRYFALIVDGDSVSVFWFRRFQDAEKKFDELIDARRPPDTYSSLGLDDPGTEMQDALAALEAEL